MVYNNTDPDSHPPPPYLPQFVSIRQGVMDHNHWQPQLWKKNFSDIHPPHCVERWNMEEIEAGQRRLGGAIKGTTSHNTGNGWK